MKHEEIFPVVQEILIDVLNIDANEVLLTSRLQGDLEAKRNDFLDIVFRLERRFEIEISINELFPDSEYLFSLFETQNRHLTYAGINQLRTKMPWLGAVGALTFAADSGLFKLQDLFTVQMVVNYIEFQIGIFEITD